MSEQTPTKIVKINLKAFRNLSTTVFKVSPKTEVQTILEKIDSSVLSEVRNGRATMNINDVRGYPDTKMIDVVFKEEYGEWYQDERDDLLDSIESVCEETSEDYEEEVTIVVVTDKFGGIQ